MSDEPSVEHSPSPRMPEDEAQCRICLDGDAPGSILIMPCLCRGTSGHVHSSCLLRQHRTRNNPTCEVCRHRYSEVFGNYQPIAERIRLFEEHMLSADVLLGWISFVVGMAAVVEVGSAVLGVLWLVGFETTARPTFSAVLAALLAEIVIDQCLPRLSFRAALSSLNVPRVWFLLTSRRRIGFRPYINS
eukprot:Hpha_TRINITY_DN19803_c0_g1::TRINITY_DN19803_c0_g1_i1::g.132074::m.132074